MNKEKKLYPIRGSLTAKIIAAILLVIMAGITVASALGIVCIFEQGLYDISEEQAQYENRCTAAEDYISNLHWRFLEEAQNYDPESGILHEDGKYFPEYARVRMEEYISSSNIGAVQIRYWGENPYSYQWADEGNLEPAEEISLSIRQYDNYWMAQESETDIGLGKIGENSVIPAPTAFSEQAIEPDMSLGKIEGKGMVRVPMVPTKYDDYFFEYYLTGALYRLKYWIYPILLVSLAAAVGLFIFLMKAAGYRRGEAEIRPGRLNRVPVDLLTAAVIIAISVCLLMVEDCRFSRSPTASAAGITVYGLAAYALAIIWCMSMASRVKLGAWWKNSVLYWLWQGMKKAGKLVFSLFCKLHLIPGTAIVWGCILLLDGIISLFLLLGGWWNPEWSVIYWILKALVFTGLVVTGALMLRKLEKGGQALAAGDLSYQVDTDRMLPAFKAHGENLNHIAEGMTAAVEERLKSERMKTELITNVSHDIKTPLTSIINYSDLIGKEQCDNEKIKEYAEVLHRQSERLKRLIEDLVEASKASTGNLEVLLAPCEADVMLTQVAGEFTQRLEDSQLELITGIPEEPVKIMADGRRLWRVFDNLLGNICKYAQSGTRVYLTLEENAGQALISFKNISREPLNLSADELMERFVRGDQSRTSEGNGLGLSIAKSLTELQKGRMNLTVDGDLFKVTLQFPIIK